MLNATQGRAHPETRKHLSQCPRPGFARVGVTGQCARCCSQCSSGPAAHSSSRERLWLAHLYCGRARSCMLAQTMSRHNATACAELAGLTRKLEVGRERLPTWPGDRLTVLGEHSSHLHDLVPASAVENVGPSAVLWPRL